MKKTKLIISAILMVAMSTSLGKSLLPSLNELYKWGEEQIKLDKSK